MHEHAELMAHLAPVEILVDLRFLAMDKRIAEKERAVLVGAELELFPGFDVYARARQAGEIWGEQIEARAVVGVLGVDVPEILELGLENAIGAGILEATLGVACAVEVQLKK